MTTNNYSATQSTLKSTSYTMYGKTDMPKREKKEEIYTLWVCVVGGDYSEDERKIYEGSDWGKLKAAIREADYEVNTDPDKYFLLNDTTFYSYEEFEDLVERRII